MTKLAMFLDREAEKKLEKQTNHRENVRVVGCSLEIMFLRLVLHSKYETDGKSKICSERMDKHAIACIDDLRNENSFDTKKKREKKKNWQDSFLLRVPRSVVMIFIF